MKIRDRVTRGVGSSGPLRGRGRAPSAEKSSKGAAVPADLVMISGRGTDIQRARSLALRAPEIRQEVVDEIVGQIERGEYQISGAEVAPKMIEAHLAIAME